MLPDVMQQDFDSFKSDEVAIYSEAEDPHGKDYPEALPIWWEPVTDIEAYQPPPLCASPIDGRAVRQVEDSRHFWAENGKQPLTMNGAICLASLKCPPGHLLTVNRISTHIRIKVDWWDMGAILGGTQGDLADANGWQWYKLILEGNPPHDLIFATGLRRPDKMGDLTGARHTFYPSPWGAGVPRYNYLPISYYGPSPWSHSYYATYQPENRVKILVPEDNLFELWLMTWGFDEESLPIMEAGGRLQGMLQDYHGNPQALDVARRAIRA